MLPHPGVMLPRSEIMFRNHIAPPLCSCRRKIHVLFPHFDRELPREGIFMLCFPMSTGNCYAHTYWKYMSCFLMSTENCLVHTDRKSASFVFSCRQRTATPVLTENHLRLVFCLFVFLCRPGTAMSILPDVDMELLLCLWCPENPCLVFSCRQGPAVSRSGEHRVWRHVQQAGRRDLRLSNHFRCCDQTVHLQRM